MICPRGRIVVSNRLSDEERLELSAAYEMFKASKSSSPALTLPICSSSLSPSPVPLQTSESSPPPLAVATSSQKPLPPPEPKMIDYIIPDLDRDSPKTISRLNTFFDIEKVRRLLFAGAAF